MDILFFISVSYSAPTSHTQKLKLTREGGHFTYSSTLPLTCSFRRAQMWNRSRLQFILINHAHRDSNSETSDSDTMLATLHRPVTSKSLN
jgi:hypothetical protein